jgi:hypothetical protein
MTMDTLPRHQGLSRGRIAAVTAVAPLPFLAATMAIYRVVVTLPDPESALAAVLLRALSITLVAVATLGSITIATWVSRRMVTAHFRRMCAGEAGRAPRASAPGRLRIVVPTPVDRERPA